MFVCVLEGGVGAATHTTKLGECLLQQLWITRSAQIRERRVTFGLRQSVSRLVIFSQRFITICRSTVRDRHQIHPLISKATNRSGGEISKTIRLEGVGARGLLVSFTAQRARTSINAAKVAICRMAKHGISTVAVDRLDDRLRTPRPLPFRSRHRGCRTISQNEEQLIQ